MRTRNTAAAALAAACLTAGSARAFLAQTLAPVAIRDQAGATGGQAVTNLAALDQSGADNDPGRYVSFLTPGTAYRGYRVYVLPDSIPLCDLAALRVCANYRGPSAGSQRWTWKLYDASRRRWLAIGDNGAGERGAWRLLTFGVDDPQRFVGTNRQLRLQLCSDNASGSARLDYEALTVLTVDTNAVPSPTLSGCPLFPSNHFWNVPVAALPVHARSDDWVDAIGADSTFHMDFGSGLWDGGPIGIPYNVVGRRSLGVPVSFYYPDESDPGPYPIPAGPRIEWGSDHHILAVDRQRAVLYEIYDAALGGQGWEAGSGAIWDLTSNDLRPRDWTSGDLAGMAILPGLTRYAEAASGRIRHALRFTAFNTADGYIWPARHPVPDQTALQGTLDRPPMGARFRLKRAYAVPDGAPPEARVILECMRNYGIVLTDHGSEWYVSGAPDERWDNERLHWFDENLRGSDFEAVDTTGLMADPDSGAAGP